MKRVFLIFLLISPLCLLAQKGGIRGVAVDTVKHQPVYASINLYTSKPIKNFFTTTDEKGNFHIDSLPAGKYVVIISPLGSQNFAAKIKIEKDSVFYMKAEFPVPCKYDKSRSDSTCPVCGRTDEVVPIVYGLPIGKIDKEKYYYAGCEITYCDPHWYCRRDEQKF